MIIQTIYHTIYKPHKVRISKPRKLSAYGITHSLAKPTEQTEIAVKKSKPLFQ